MFEALTNNSIDRRLSKLQRSREKSRAFRAACAEKKKFNSEPFIRFCNFQVLFTRARAKAGGYPHNITSEYIEHLFIDQNWRCAVSGIPFAEPRRKKEPFSPSIDRIIPERGYAIGNVRIVCTIVNFAMNDWGEEPLLELMRRWRKARLIK